MDQPLFIRQPANSDKIPTRAFKVTSSSRQAWKNSQAFSGQQKQSPITNSLITPPLLSLLVDMPLGIRENF